MLQRMRGPETGLHQRTGKERTTTAEKQVGVRERSGSASPTPRHRDRLHRVVRFVASAGARGSSRLLHTHTRNCPMHRILRVALVAAAILPAFAAFPQSTSTWTIRDLGRPEQNVI